MPGTTDRVEWVTPAWVSHKTGISYKTILGYVTNNTIEHYRAPLRGSRILIRWPLSSPSIQRDGQTKTA